VAQIRAEGGEASAFEADVTREAEVEALIALCAKRHGRIDVLHNNVGIGGGDAGPAHVNEEAWDLILSVNLKSVVFPCKHVLPVMRAQQGGSIINVSSIAAVCSTGIVAYKTSKAGVNAYTQSLAIGNAKYGIRANVIMPGLIDTPMAIERRAKERGVPREVIRAEREALVPLGRMGTAWDVANAAVFLASDEARYITGVVLPVDGGLIEKRG
jgi:NAD(P)-dependent dehydrogenase (short-subunit alcohol dehydrogenase family)